MIGQIVLTPDTPIWQWGWLSLNRTILFTWVVMACLLLGSWIVTRNLSSSTSMSRSQNLLEVIVQALRTQIREVSRQEPGPYLPFVGTLFVFIVACNFFAIVPGFHTPTSSLSTTTALATCVFVAVPIYGISKQGLTCYLQQYVRPSFLMLPFNIVGELSRTLSLAVRLYGNMMSGTVIAAIILGFAPLFVPVLLQSFGLLTGVIQAYIFAILAMVYIASATQARGSETDDLAKLEEATDPNQTPDKASQAT